MHRGARHTQGLGLLEDLIVPRGLVVGVQKEMSMAFDHPRHQRLAGEINPEGVLRQGDPSRGARRLDPIAPHQHGPSHVARSPIEDRVGAEEDRVGCFLGTGGTGKGEDNSQDEGDTPAEH